MFSSENISKASNGTDVTVNNVLSEVPVISNSKQLETEPMLPRLFEKSVIIHRDKNGFGLRVKGQAPVFVEQVYENGAAWRAGVRRFDKIHKVNGQLVTHLDHREVVLMIKDCLRFVALTLLGSIDETRKYNICEELAHESSLSDLIQPPCSILQASHKRHKSLPATYSNIDVSQYLNVSSSTLADLTPLSISTTLHSNYMSSPSSDLNAHAKLSPVAKRSENVSQPKSQKQLVSGKGTRISGTIPMNGHRFDLIFGVHDPRCMGCGILLGESVHYTCSRCEASAHKSCLKKVSEAPCWNSHLERLKTCSPKNKPNAAYKNQEESKFPKRDRVLQSSSSSSLPANGSTPSDENEKANMPIRPSNRRQEIIRELLSTEKAHTERLKHLDDLFYRPMKAESLVSQEQLRMVFSCHKTLLRIHKQIYKVLLSTQYNRFNEPLIGAALVQIFEGDIGKRLEKAACTFCSCQSTNTELLNKLSRRDTKVGDFLAQAANQQLIGRLGLKDLLASCFQRLTKYPLLLENLLKATPTAMIDGANFGEEHEFIRRSLHQSRQILIRVNEAVKMATSQTKLKEIWKKTDKHSSVPIIDISKQQLVHEGPLTLRLSKRSFDVYVLLLNDYLCIMIRDHQDKYKLKPFFPDGKSTSQPFYSPVFVIDEHLTTRDSATDENGFYLLCKKKDDSRIYEFGALSPNDRSKWRDKIQWTIENQILKLTKNTRRQSYESTSTKSGSDNSSRPDLEDINLQAPQSQFLSKEKSLAGHHIFETENGAGSDSGRLANVSESNSSHPTKMEGTISYVGEDDVLIMPSKIEKCEIVIRESVRMVSVQQKLKLIDRNLKNLLEQKLALIAVTSMTIKDNSSAVSEASFNETKDCAKLDLNLPSKLSVDEQSGEKWLNLAIGAMNVSSLMMSENEFEQSNMKPNNLREAIVGLRTHIDSFLKGSINDQSKLSNINNSADKKGSD